MKRSRQVLIVVALAAVAGALALVATVGAARQQKVVLTVGLTQDVDSMNPTVGVLVPDYDVWNLQYATLTDKAAADFKTVPGLATSWKVSNGGRTYTYTLRKGLKWSDGKPLTSADVLYTINRAHKEAWLNYSPTLDNITARAPNATTVVITSTVPDPKLPTMDVYILPQHVWSKVTKDGLRKYAATDGVGSGPFVLDKWVKGQYWRLRANPNYFRGKPKIDEIVFRPFRNADAMVLGLKKGELDFIHAVPESQFEDLAREKGIVTVEGEQGGFDELAFNAYAGKPARDTAKFGKASPALKDVRFRQALAHAISKEAIVSRVLNGIGRPGVAVSPSADPKWIPNIPKSQQFEFNLEKAKKLLDAAGYKDSNGNGVRELPGTKQDIVLRYLVRTESENAKPISEFVGAWFEEVGVGTKISLFNDTQLTVEIGKGNYDMFTWGWTPYVDPDPMLSYFQCNQISKDATDFTNYYNDASWCDPVYDQLYLKQKVELDPVKRVAIVHQMLTRFYRSAAYIVLDTSPDLQAYRTDRFSGWTRQPTKVGPVLFSNTSPSYFNLRPLK